MFLAIAALLIQPQLAPQLSFSAEKMALIQPANSAISLSATASENSLPPAPADLDAPMQPVAASDSAALPDAPVPAAAAVNTPVPLAFIKPANPMTVSVGELLAENRRNQFIWRGLTIASSLRLGPTSSSAR